MKPKVYKLLEMCVEDGYKVGWKRAHKHCEKPTDEQIQGDIQTAIMAEINEWFTFWDENGI